MSAPSLKDLQEQLEQVGSTALVLPSSDTVPPQSEWNRWLVIPTPEGHYIVGGISEGVFRIYSTLISLQGTLTLLAELEQPCSRPHVIRELHITQESGKRLHAAVNTRWMTRPGRGPAELAAGDSLDMFGFETGHRLIAAGTPWEMRSQPPTDYQLPYRVYEVVSPPPGVVEGVAGPWFEQPGGAAMFITEHPIRWYLDNGYLQEVDLP